VQTASQDLSAESALFAGASACWYAWMFPVSSRRMTRMAPIYSPVLMPPCLDHGAFHRKRQLG
jgi:hypothetical protein